jgi:hypothetical protein
MSRDGVCLYELCKDWSWDGCGWHGVHNFKGSIPNIVWSCGGGCCNGVTSYSTRSETTSGKHVGGKDGGGKCEDTQLIAYQKPHYKGHSQPMRGHWQRIDRKAKSGCGEDWWASIKETKIPKTMRGKLKRVETDAECHGADKVYKKVAGKINACFYSSTDEKKIRQVYDRKGRDSNMGGLYNTLRDDFCGRRDNVFKNPGGGLCQEYDTGKKLAKEYCAVGDRMATDSSCTSKNLGNAYASLAATFCKTAAGKKHVWCSCYNVTNGVCKNDASAAGCAKKKQTFDELVAATPKKFRNSWNGMESCFGGVCAGDKYLPTGYNANCSRPVQVCVQEFNINAIADSKINATCNQKVEKGGGGGGSGGSAADEGSSSTTSGDGGSSGDGDGGSKKVVGRGSRGKSNNLLVYGGGFAGLSASSLCCCLIIILLMFM